ncbi:hypothetical protein MBAV_001360, partial [Candidatus Magnetobacterium bavaricum]
TEDIPLNKHKRHTIDVVIDRLIIKPQFERKLKDSINIALKFSNIVLINLIAENDSLVKSIAENQDIKDFYYIAALIVNPASKDENIKAALIEQLILSNLNNYSIIF